MESVQTDINPMMRSILVDWLVEVAQEYRLTSDTLFLSVSYIDRYLSQIDVRRNKLQLVRLGLWAGVGSAGGAAARGERALVAGSCTLRLLAITNTAAPPQPAPQVGVTCMLVASKYEEIYAPAIDEFCYITDNTYTREQVGGRVLLQRCAPRLCRCPL